MKRKKSVFWCLILSLILVLFLAFAVEANATDQEMNLAEQFPVLKFKDQFIQNAPAKYYRFPADIWHFDPLGLSYFPFESIDSDNWAMLGRWKDGKTSQQMIYLDKPAAKKMIHGIDLGQGPGYLRDFYLYADLFVSDNFPEQTGSCFLYFSNSMLVGYDTSYGIFIDPQDGIYKATNDYKSSSSGFFSGYYHQGDEKHNLDLMTRLDSSEYALEVSTISDELSESLDSTVTTGSNQNGSSLLKTSSIGSSLFPAADLDKQFGLDLESLISKKEGNQESLVQAYRIEIVRLNGKVDLYINGKLAAAFNDEISTTKDGQKAPDKVTWSYGPVLFQDGNTVTCSIGNLVIYGTGQRED